MGDIDRLLHGWHNSRMGVAARRTTANAGSATFTADVVIRFDRSLTISNNWHVKYTSKQTAKGSKFQPVNPSKLNSGLSFASLYFVLYFIFYKTNIFVQLGIFLPFDARRICNA